MPLCSDKTGAFHLRAPHWLKKRRAAAMALTLLAIALGTLYVNSFDCDWHLDDHLIIFRNPNLHLKTLTWRNLLKTAYAPQTDSSAPEVISRPIVSLSLALNYYFGREAVFGYHLVNLAIHYLAAVFLYLLVANTLKLPNLRDRYGQYADAVALLTAFLWATSPIQIFSVTYIVQRMSSMAGLGYIAALYFFMKGRTTAPSHSRRGWFSCAAVAGIMALGSKESAATLPFSMILYDLLLIRAYSATFHKKHLRLIIVSVLFFIVLGLLFVWGGFGGSAGLLSEYDRFTFTMAERVLSAPRILLF